MKPLVFLIIACSGCVLAITNEKRTYYKRPVPVDRSFIGSLLGGGSSSSWFGGQQDHERRGRPIHYHYRKPQPLRPMMTHHQSYEKPAHQRAVKLQHPAPQKYAIIKKIPYQVKVPVPRPVPVKVSVPKPYTVEKKVPVPFKVYVPHPYTVEKKVPYPVKVKVPVPQPYLVERKVPFEVKVPVEKPYIVHVPKPYPVYFEEHAAGGKHSHQAYKPKPIPMHAHYESQATHNKEATPNFAGHDGEWKLGQDHANNYYFQKKHANEIIKNYLTPEDWPKHHEAGFYEPSIDAVKYDGLQSSNSIKFDESNTIKFEDDDWNNQDHGFSSFEGKYRASSIPETFEDPHSTATSEAEQPQKSQYENNSQQLEVHEFESLPQPLQLVQLSEHDVAHHTNQIPEENTQVIYGQADENQGGFKPPTDVFYINPSKDGNVVQSSYNVGETSSANVKPVQEYPIYVANINNGKQSVQADYQVNEETGEPEQNKKPENYYANYLDSRNSRKLPYPAYYTSDDMITTGGQMLPSVYYTGYNEMVPSLNRRYDYVEQPLVRPRTTPAHTSGKSMRRMDFEPQFWAKPNMSGWTPIESSRRDDGTPQRGDERS